jgi:hypothetical protein
LIALSRFSRKPALMSKRREILTAIAVVLRRIADISEELSKPGARLDSLQEEWHRQEMKYQRLMDRLEEGPCEEASFDTKVTIT